MKQIGRQSQVAEGPQSLDQALSLGDQSAEKKDVCLFLKGYGGLCLSHGCKPRTAKNRNTRRSKLHLSREGEARRVCYKHSKRTSLKSPVPQAISDLPGSDRASETRIIISGATRFAKSCNTAHFLVR